MTIWKYDLEITDEQKIKMPLKAKVLCVQIQNGLPKIWIKVNPENEKEERTFLTVGTGHIMLKNDMQYDEYIGTYQFKELVFHLFERKEF